MSEPSLLNFLAKVGLYFVLGKSLNLLCNIIKDVYLIISFLQEFFDVLFQALERFDADAQYVAAVYEEHGGQVGHVVNGNV